MTCLPLCLRLSTTITDTAEVPHPKLRVIQNVIIATVWDILWSLFETTWAPPTFGKCSSHHSTGHTSKLCHLSQLQLTMRTSSSGLRVIRTRDPLLQLHTLVIHLLASLNSLLLDPGSLTLLRLTTSLIIKSLFSSISTPSYLPLAWLQPMVLKPSPEGFVLPNSSLPVSFVLYVPECPFNLLSIIHLTRSHDCIVTFTNNNVTL